ncbi:MAG: signal peptidase I [Bacillota bacterium]|nr:signal peptidase I [Bacillota bacterium]
MTKDLRVDIMCLVWKILLFVGLFCGIFLFVFGVTSVEDRAMFPSIKDGDLVIFNRWDKVYSATDVVVIERNGEKQVCRVAAVAGDTVDIGEGGLLINGALQQENGIYERTYRYREGIEFPITLEKDEIFVLGDARENSTDSRIYGPVKMSDTCGTVMALLRHRGI